MLAAYQDWRRKAEGAASDYGFHMAVTWWDKSVFDEMETVVKTYGINTFKHFMAYKGALMVNDDQLYNSFARCSALGAMPIVHAENGDLIWHLQQYYLGSGMTGPEGHAYSRPPAVEGEATNRAIMIADMAGCPVYIVHTSSRDAHEAIARARAAGQRVYGEPIIQHLVLDENEYRNKDWEYAARRVMSPPFRTKEHRDSLWAGLQSGSLHAVATDHCAFTTEQKRLGRGDFTKIPNGTGGLEDRLSVLWTAGVAPGRLTKEEFVAVTSANIARISISFRRRARSRSAPMPMSSSSTRRRPRRSRRRSKSAVSTTMCSKALPARGCRASRCRAARSFGLTAICAPRPAPANTWRAIRSPPCMSPTPSGANSTPRTRSSACR
jgi:dihydropyrimidinase